MGRINGSRTEEDPGGGWEGQPPCTGMGTQQQMPTRSKLRFEGTPCRQAKGRNSAQPARATRKETSRNPSVTTMRAAEGGRRREKTERSGADAMHLKNMRITTRDHPQKTQKPRGRTVERRKSNSAPAEGKFTKSHRIRTQ